MFCTTKQFLMLLSLELFFKEKLNQVIKRDDKYAGCVLGDRRYKYTITQSIYFTL